MQKPYANQIKKHIGLNALLIPLFFKNEIMVPHFKSWFFGPPISLFFLLLNFPSPSYFGVIFADMAYSSMKWQSLYGHNEYPCQRERPNTHYA